jgi:hypothetical protein
MFHKWAPLQRQHCLSVMQLKFVCLYKSMMAVPKKWFKLRYLTVMFSFYAGSEMNTEKVWWWGKMKQGDVIVFHLVPYCCYVLSYLVSHQQFFATLSVMRFPATLTSRPWIHGSTTITVLVPAVLINPWFLRISTDPTGCIVIYQCNRCVAVTHSFLARLLSVPFSGRSHMIIVGAFK